MLYHSILLSLSCILFRFFWLLLLASIQFWITKTYVFYFFAISQNFLIHNTFWPTLIILFSIKIVRSHTFSDTLSHPHMKMD
jgi:hypothetical protein